MLPIVPFLASFAMGLTVQRARVDITPPERLPLGGYTARQGRVMDLGGDHLYARCVLLSQGTEKVAIVSVEMLTIPDSLAREVHRFMPEGVALFLCATHTHSAPDSQVLNDHMTFSIPGIATYKSRWLKWYAERIASSIRLALSHKAQQIKSLEADEFELSLNRGRRAGALPEQTATVLETGGSALLAQYAAHAVFYGPERNKTSGDWPGELSRRNRQMPVLMGAIGDVSPAAPGRTSRDRISAFVTQFQYAWRHNAKRVPLWDHRAPKLFSFMEGITLEPVQPHPNFGRDYHIPQALAQTLAEKFAPTRAALSIIGLGNLAIVGVPGEPTSHLGRRIREAGLAMGFKSVLVVSHVNGWIGYILDPQDYARGGYEANLSFYGPREGEHVVESAIAGLKTLAALADRLQSVKSKP